LSAPVSPFRPLHQKAFLVQEAVARLPGMPKAAALLYGRMARFTAHDGQCFASVDYLARELHASTRSVERWMAALVSAKLIRREYRYALRSKVTVFLPHPCFGAPPPEPQPVQLSLFPQAVENLCKTPLGEVGAASAAEVENLWKSGGFPVGTSASSVGSDPPTLADPSIELRGSNDERESSRSAASVPDPPPVAGERSGRPFVVRPAAHTARDVARTELGWHQPPTRSDSPPRRTQTSAAEFAEQIAELARRRRIPSP